MSKKLSPQTIKQIGCLRKKGSTYQAIAGRLGISLSVAHYWGSPEYRKGRRAYFKNWRQSNPEKAREGKLRWAVNHAELMREYKARWAKSNPEKVLEKKRRYRARKKQNNGAAA